MFDLLPLVLAQSPDEKPISKDAAKDGAPVAGKDEAKTTTPGAPQQQLPQQRPGGAFDNMFFIILLGGIILMIVFSMRGQRRERKKREELLSAVKKGDRIQTIGGILGTVVEIREQRVTLKIDENTNTRMQIARSAIQTVLEDKSETKEAELEKKA